MLVVRARRNDGEVTRIGMSTPRGLGGAVIRNRLRRRMREALRLRYRELAPGWDVLVSARVAARDARFDDLGASLDRLLRRCGVLPPLSA